MSESGGADGPGVTGKLRVPVYPPPPRPAVELPATAGYGLAMAVPAVLLLGLGLWYASPELGLLALVPLTLALILGLHSIATLSADKQRLLNEWREQYRTDVRAAVARAKRIVDEQAARYEAAHPDLAECGRRVEAGSGVWSRSGSDRDFLRLRVGMAQITSPLDVQLLAPSGDIVRDRLVGEARAEIAAGTAAKPAPFPVDLGDRAIVALEGPAEDVDSVARAMVVQLATHYPPDEVFLAALLLGRSSDSWLWVRWLPHVWSPSGERRLVATDVDASADLLGAVSRILAQPMSQDRPLRRRCVILLAGHGPEASEAQRQLAAAWPRLGGAAALVLGPVPRRQLRGEFVHVRLAHGEPPYEAEVTGSKVARVQPDRCPLRSAEAIARGLARIARRSKGAGDASPPSMGVLEVLDGAREGTVDIARRWAAARGHRALRAPIGLTLAGAMRMLDLRLHGPSVVVAGADAAARERLAESILVLLAATYHPDDLSYVVADLGPGDLARRLEALPHVTTVFEGAPETVLRGLGDFLSSLVSGHALGSLITMESTGPSPQAEVEARQPFVPRTLLVVNDIDAVPQALQEHWRAVLGTLRDAVPAGAYGLFTCSGRPLPALAPVLELAKTCVCGALDEEAEAPGAMAMPGATALAPDEVLVRSGKRHRPNKLALLALDRSDSGLVRQVALDGRRMALTAPRSAAQASELHALVRAIAAAAPLVDPRPSPLPDLAEAVSGIRSDDGREAVVVCAVRPADRTPVVVPLSQGPHWFIGGHDADERGDVLVSCVLAAMLACPRKLHVYLAALGSERLRWLGALEHVRSVAVDLVEVESVLDEVEALAARIDKPAAEGVAAPLGGATFAPRVLLALDDRTGLATDPASPLSRQLYSILARTDGPTHVLVAGAADPHSLAPRLGLMAQPRLVGGFGGGNTAPSAVTVWSLASDAGFRPTSRQEAVTYCRWSSDQHGESYWCDLIRRRWL